ncbi:hypothetical protein G6M26_30890 [Agrobacterium tumefaciens]|nr:hypothetical protein [Agrobacterium tumefaciens]NTE22959.1 hypothetical protein [Agrobacterium tumefaciens]
MSEALTYYNIQVGKKARQTKLPQHAGSFFKPSAAAMAFLAPETKLSNAQKKLISKLCQSSAELKRIMALVKKFRRLIVTFHIVSYLTRHKNKAVVSVS